MNSPYRFGATPVSRAQREDGVAAVFASVADRYDLMNDLMSAGCHRLWKKAMIAWAKPRENERWLDLAAGSGDITGLLADTGAAVTAVDPSEPMLEKAKRRLGDRDNIDFVVASAESLPFNDADADAGFDGLTCAFGLRNFTDRAESLAQIARVLEPGGCVLIMEFCPPRGPLASLHKGYLNAVLPELGAAVVDDRASYEYLAQSIIDFPKPEQIVSELEEVGLAKAHWRSFAFGAVAIYRAWKTW